MNLTHIPSPFARAALLALSLAALTCLLPGCGGGGGGSSSSSPTPTGSSSPTPTPSPSGIPTPGTRGSVVSATRVGRLQRATMNIALVGAGLSSLTPARYDVDFYTVTYQTVSFDGTTPVIVSGMVALPVGTSGARPLAAYFHGTSTVRTDVPSNNTNAEAQLVSAGFAAAGYVVTAPDYIGLGSSPAGLRQTFEHADSLATTGIDMMRAARSVAATQNVPLNGQVFLAGYSEGGYATLAVQRSIEANYATEFAITASAPIAGPYDLSGTTLQTFLASPGPNASAEVSGLLLGYKQIYPVYTNLSDAMASPFDAQMPALFDGTHSLPQIEAALPANLSGLLTPAYLAALQNDPNQPLNVALRANDVYNWKNVAPIRLYHGEADLDVSFQNAVVAQQHLSASGGNAQIVDLGADIDHGAAVVPATKLIRDWFDSLVSDSL